MFTDIRADSSSKLFEVRQFLDFIRDHTPAPPDPTPIPLISARGLFFVHLYGVYERTIRDTVFRAIRVINQNGHRILDLKPVLLSIALHSECDAIAFSHMRNWEKRWSLFEPIDLNPAVEFCEVLPTDGKNIKHRQLEMIWKTLSINQPVMPKPEIGGRIQELVDNRNAIAHGDSTAHEIGARVSITDLYQKYNDISGYCSYFVGVFENHICNMHYLKRS